MNTALTHLVHTQFVPSDVILSAVTHARALKATGVELRMNYWLVLSGSKLCAACLGGAFYASIDPNFEKLPDRLNSFRYVPHFEDIRKTDPEIVDAMDFLNRVRVILYSHIPDKEADGVHYTFKPLVSGSCGREPAITAWLIEHSSDNYDSSPSTDKEFKAFWEKLEAFATFLKTLDL